MPYYPHDNIVGDHSCEECKKSNERSACHKLLSMSRLLEQICVQTKDIKSADSLSNIRHVKTICEHTLDKSQTVSNCSFLKLWSSKQAVDTLYNCWLSIRQLAIHGGSQALTLWAPSKTRNAHLLDRNGPLGSFGAQFEKWAPKVGLFLSLFGFEKSESVKLRKTL